MPTRPGPLYLFCCHEHQLYRPLDAEFFCIQRQIKISGIAVGLARIVRTIPFTRLIRSLHIRSHLFLRGIRHHPGHSPDAPLKTGVDKNIQTVIEFPQNIIPVSSDDDAAFLVRQSPDGFLLRPPQLFVQRPVVEIKQALRKPETAGHLLIPFEDLLRIRSEERRGGRGCARTCRSRWAA